MADRFQKVGAGQPLEISADVWNQLIDVAQAAKQSQHDQSSNNPATKRRADIVRVRNQTNFTFERFGIVGLQSPIIAPSQNLPEFKNEVTFDVGLPDGSPRFGVVIEPLQAGAIGKAVVAGVIATRIIVPDVAYACAVPIAGQHSGLVSVPHGPAQVLWMEASGATRWAIIRFDDSNYEEMVYVTSNKPGEDGYYPGIVQRYDIATRAWLSQYSCKVLDANQ